MVNRLEGHKYAERLIPKEAALVREMSKKTHPQGIFCPPLGKKFNEHYNHKTYIQCGKG
jgi:hypothetical protein